MLLFSRLIFLILFVLAIKPGNTQIPAFQNNERICFIGSSIAMNGANFHYINLFYATRYPGKNITFINSGISGDNTDNILDRFENDILVNKPTWAVLMIEENDLGPSLYYKDRQNEPGIREKQTKRIEHWCKNVDSLASLLLKANVKVILQTPTIYDQTGKLPAENAYGLNDALGQCVQFLFQLSKKYNLPIVDCWTVMNEDNKKIQEKDPANTIIGNDRMHVSKLGYFVMAHTFLKSQDIEKKVAKVRLDVLRKKKVAVTNCTVNNFSFNKKGASFNYQPWSYPFPVPDGVKPDSLHPFTSDLNEEIFEIRGLHSGNYKVTIDTALIGVFSDKELEMGINVSMNPATQQYKKSQEILSLFYEYWKNERKLRLIKYVEYQHFDGNTQIANNMDSLKAKMEAILNRNKTSDNYNFFKRVFDEYLANKVNEKEIEQKNNLLFRKIQEVDKPGIHTVKIRKIF